MESAPLSVTRATGPPAGAQGFLLLGSSWGPSWGDCSVARYSASKETGEQRCISEKIVPGLSLSIEDPSYPRPHRSRPAVLYPPAGGRPLLASVRCAARAVSWRWTVPNSHIRWRAGTSPAGHGFRWMAGPAPWVSPVPVPEQAAASNHCPASARGLQALKQAARGSRLSPAGSEAV